MSWNRPIFFQMFGIALLLNIYFTILRNVRNTLAVDQGNGAQQTQVSGFIYYHVLVFGSAKSLDLLTCLHSSR